VLVSPAETIPPRPSAIACRTAVRSRPRPEARPIAGTGRRRQPACRAADARRLTCETAPFAADRSTLPDPAAIAGFFGRLEAEFRSLLEDGTTRLGL
jgi:hypothetical protein